MSCPVCGRREGTIRFWAIAILGLVTFGLGALTLAGWIGVGEITPWARHHSSAVLPAARRDSSPRPVVRSEGGPSARLALFAAPAGGGQAILFLDRMQKLQQNPRNDFHGLLEREILRQAVLLAARENLGLGTRDATLREPPPEGQPRLSLDFPDPVFLSQYTSLTILDGQGKPLCQESLPVGPPEGPNYLALLEGAEALSRKQIPQALREAGIEGKAHALRATGAVPRQAEEALPRMNFLGQVTALRALHAAMRDQGESPELLGALVRAYANLGVLTEFHWNAAHKAYHARALLYAQRLVARDPQSPWGLYHRAYALALVGLHRAALDDLEKARKQQEKLRGSSVPPRPAWADLIEAYCHFDSRRLEAEKDKGQRQLALLLRCLNVEGCGCTALILRTYADVLEEMPECFRIQDATGDVGGVSNLHEATTRPIVVFGKVMPRRLRQIPDLPAPVQKLLGQESDEPAVYRALVEAGKQDSEEPSWSAVGRMLQETRFAQVVRRAHFMRYSWGVPVRDFLEEADPLIEGHPFHTLVQMYGQSERERRDSCAQLVSQLPLSELEMPQEQMLIWEIKRTAPELLTTPWTYMQRHGDHVYREYTGAVTNPNANRSAGHKLLEISPHSPLAVAALIEQDWDFAEPHLAEWKKTYAHQAVVLGALGKRYLKLGQEQEAEHYLKEYIQASPDKWAFETLATIYSERGDFEKWRETLEACLKGEDSGLDHAQIRVKIARYYMSCKEWEKALPYAEQAAASGAAWAMTCAAQCNEGLEDWDRAEFWMQQIAERYNNQQLDWFFWCERTGKGHSKAAQQLAAAYVRELSVQAGANQQLGIGIFDILIGRPWQGLAAFESSHEEKPSDVGACLVALTADALGRRDRRDVLWQKLAKRKSTLGLLARHFRDCLARGEKETPNAQDLEALFQLLRGRERSNAHWVVGRFLQLHGRPKEAAEHLQACVGDPQGHDWIRTLAAVELRELKAKGQ